MKIKLILAASIFFFSSICSAAPIVLVDIEGVITSSEDRFDYLGMGAGDGALDGKSISLSLTYDTALNPPNSSGIPTTSSYRQLNDPIWMTLPIVEIDGIAVEPPEPPFPADSFDADQSMRITPSEDKMRLTRDLDYVVRDIDYGYYYLDFWIQVDLLFSGLGSSIPDFLPADDFLGGSGQFFIDEEHNSELLNSVYVRFNVTSASFATVESVPEPAVLLLFGIGLLGLIGVKWRRKAAS